MTTSLKSTNLQLEVDQNVLKQSDNDEKKKLRLVIKHSYNDWVLDDE